MHCQKYSKLSDSWRMADEKNSKPENTGRAILISYTIPFTIPKLQERTSLMPLPFDTQLSLMQYHSINFFPWRCSCSFKIKNFLEKGKLALSKSVLSSFNF